ncbi:SDR family NAD(P)-dependent oxidoreductase [Pseudolabrys taiwanensis]|uniref:SDR family NAD(P)-dependent oxidoreductase n=1 Tax=Pseudolabrys taiwanensis TaxID=331696 RepID=A0A345ZVM0_9HYPH|nr:SDR family NAD(P)-dependent oxidoreductase [Pseudolabrys taiwanensis]
MIDNAPECNEGIRRVELNGKIILVTGAAGAIGSAIVRSVRAAGGTAIASDLVGAAGVDATLDVTSETHWQDVTTRIGTEHGRLDGLVNAAGIAVVGSIEKTDFATYRRVMAINLDGTYLGCHYAFPLLRKRGGAIVNLSSVLGLIGGPNLAAYSASKGGVSLLTKSVALAGARYQPPVRCNAVCPAFIEGPMVDGIAQSTRHPDTVRQKLALDIPLQRLGQPEEVASLCVYLLSDASAYITGVDVPIDGGLTAK